MRPARGRASVAAAAAVAVLATLLTLAAPGRAADDAADSALYLVTLDGPGTAGLPGEDATELLRAQDDLLAAVDADEPLYRWTTALNGVAVELDREQADILAGDPRVELMERDRVVPLAAAHVVRAARALSQEPTPPRRRPSGAGTVIGFVDTGIAPESPAFRAATHLGPLPSRFRGSCDDAPDDDAWDAGSCDAKVVGAQFFVEAYGAERLRSVAALSPYDTDGHGTRMATVAAGATDAHVRVAQHRLGRFSGVAPRARVAAYKACWSAPDPDDDGCAIADVVAAIDRATSDRVDVLNLSIGGPSSIDTVERALLGATEQGIVVTAAAGNAGDRSYAAHPSPWVVTVGATTDGGAAGEVITAGGPRLRGAMAVTSPVAGRLVLAVDVAADGAGRRAARHCTPGSLDAAEADGAVVVCARGAGPRVDKSRAVALAGGVGMVLVNPGRGSTDADLHAVPTVHLGAEKAGRLLTWVEHADRARVRLVPRGVDRAPADVVGFSSGGDPTSTVLKPDLVAPGSEVIAATGNGWDLVTGTSPAAARVAGTAAALLGRPGATAATVRSALLTTTAPLDHADALRVGGGLVRLAESTALAYVVPPGAYRAWLSGERAELNLPQVLLSEGRLRARRTLTNMSGRTVEVSGSLRGFDGPVWISPAYARLRPGESVRFRIVAVGQRTSTDDGTMTWHTDDGDDARIPVAITR